MSARRRPRPWIAPLAAVMVACAPLVSAPILTTPVVAQTMADDNTHSVAVIIGNSKYRRTLEVTYAHNDAQRMRRFLVEQLGFQDRNIIYREDATAGDMLDIFGDAQSPRGELWSRIRKGQSNVFVFYSGHGVPVAPPGVVGRSEAYLLPVDVAADAAHRGLSLDILERNLAALKADIGPDRWIVLMLDACFSGDSAGGTLLQTSMGIGRPRFDAPQGEVIRLAAAQADQLAQWDKDAKNGLFTATFLSAVGGAADKAPYGDGNGEVSGPELQAYLAEEVYAAARRQARAEQQPSISGQLAMLRVPANPEARVALNQCSTLAANPDDADRPSDVPGVTFGRLKARAAEAVAACRTAASVFPNNRRAVYQYARALDASGDHGAAMKQYERAETMGSLIASIGVGLLHRDGDGVPRDPLKAKAAFERAANGGLATGYFFLGHYHDKGFGGAPDYRLALELYEKAAKAGDSDGWNNIGLLHENGRGVPRSDVEAARYYTLAAEAGNLWGLSNLGNFHRDGRGLPKNEAKARELYEKALAGGLTAAATRLGFMLETGRGGARDVNRARLLYEQAAAEDDALALNNLGVMYRDGVGVKRSDKTARDYFERGAKLGNVLAQNNLGFFLETGRGGATDMKRAVKLYEAAAKGGNVTAMNNLANAYQNGRGVAKNPALAKEWRERAEKASP